MGCGGPSSVHLSTLSLGAEGSGMDTYLEEIDDLDSGADVVEYIRTAFPVWATESDRAMRVP